VIDEQTKPLVTSPESPETRAHADPIIALVEGALLLDIVVVLCLIRTLIPIPGFQGLIRLVCPAPFVLLGLRHGIRSTVVATIGSYVVLSALVGPLFGTQILVYGLLGTVYAAAARTRLPYLLALVFGAIIYGGYIAFLTVGVPLVLGVINLHISAGELIAKIRDQLKSVAHAVVSFRLGPLSLRRLPLSGPRELFHWTLDHWVVALIAIVAIYGLINSWAFLFVTREILARVDRDVRVDAQGRRVDFYPPTQF
jgi:predicted membrane protein DUF2232